MSAEPLHKLLSFLENLTRASASSRAAGRRVKPHRRAVGSEAALAAEALEGVLVGFGHGSWFDEMDTFPEDWEELEPFSDIMAPPLSKSLR